jgi:tripartite-type tricarboxylate transporter receptor subunit TctC
MKRWTVLLATLAAAASVVAACTQAAPSPAPSVVVPTAAAPTVVVPTAAAPTKAAQPTAAAAAPATPVRVAESTQQATAAPAKNVDFPIKGKPITLIVPFSAGGGADISARLLAANLETELGTPVQIANKPGASTQVGSTELAQARPDGYTIGQTTFASIFVTYLDKERKATYGRKDFSLVANYVSIDNVIFSKADGPYKDLKSLVDAARANPESVKVGTTGPLSNGHIVPFRLQNLTGVKFAYVTFAGGADLTAGVLGGHIDAAGSSAGEAISPYKSGTLRVLGTTGKEQSKYFPDVKTFVAQGYQVLNSYDIGIAAPAGTPPEIVAVLSAAVKKATQNADLKTKFNAAAMDPNYMDPAQYSAYWTEYESQIAPLIDLAKQSQ